jgi:tetratricopeptide (TPR) repeat protein
MISRDFLRGLSHLSKAELATVARYETDSNGAGFTAVADILRRRGHTIEAIVVLEDGLQRFPKVASARASLAADYLSEGMIPEALRAAMAAIEQTPDNVLANRLALRMLVQSDRREDVLLRLKVLETLVPDDSLTSGIRKLVAAGDWAGAGAGANRPAGCHVF